MYSFSIEVLSAKVRDTVFSKRLICSLHQRTTLSCSVCSADHPLIECPRLTSKKWALSITPHLCSCCLAWLPPLPSMLALWLAKTSTFFSSKGCFPYCFFTWWPTQPIHCECSSALLVLWVVVRYLVVWLLVFLWTCSTNARLRSRSKLMVVGQVVSPGLPPLSLSPSLCESLEDVYIHAICMIVCLPILFLICANRHECILIIYYMYMACHVHACMSGQAMPYSRVYH